MYVQFVVVVPDHHHKLLFCVASQSLGSVQFIIKFVCHTVFARVHAGAKDDVLGVLVTSSFLHYWKYDHSVFRIFALQSLVDQLQFVIVTWLFHAVVAHTLQAAHICQFGSLIFGVSHPG